MHDLPWGKFFWDKWRNDHALQSCDMAAQGLWINLLCIMHRSERIGYLILNGKAMSVGDIAKFTGIRKDRAERLIAKLKTHGVCSVDENGVIYSRRIVREQEVRVLQPVNKSTETPVDNIQETLQFNDNLTKIARKSHDNRNQNQGKPKVAAISSIKSKEIEFKKEKRKKEQLTEDVNQTFSAFIKTACKRLQEVAKIDATKALSQIEVWFEEAAHDGEVVLKAIETGWGEEYPIGYISKVISNSPQHSIASKRWVIDAGKYAEDQKFQLLSKDAQLAILNFEKQKNIPKWLIKHTENYQPSAFKYLCNKGLIPEIAGV